MRKNYHHIALTLIFGLLFAGGLLLHNAVLHNAFAEPKLTIIEHMLGVTAEDALDIIEEVAEEEAEEVVGADGKKRPRTTGLKQGLEALQGGGSSGSAAASTTASGATTATGATATSTATSAASTATSASTAVGGAGSVGASTAAAGSVASGAAAASAATGISTAVVVGGSIAAAAVVVAVAVADKPPEQEKPPESPKKAEDNVVIVPASQKFHFSTASSTHIYSDTLANLVDGQSSVRVKFDVRSTTTCGVPAFVDSGNVVDGEGNAYSNDYYIDIASSYKKASDTSFTDDTATAQKFSGIYPINIGTKTVPNNDYMRAHARGGYENNAFYFDFPLPAALKTAPHVTNAQVKYVIKADAIKDANGRVICHIGDNKEHLVTLKHKDAKLQFATPVATDIFSNVAAAGAKITFSLDASGNICGVPGFGTGANADDSNGDVFNANDYIKVTAEYALGSAQNSFTPITDANLTIISGIYPSAVTLPSNDWQDNASKIFTGNQFRFALPIPNTATSPAQDGTIIRFSLQGTGITDPRTGVVCNFTGNTTHTVVLNNTLPTPAQLRLRNNNITKTFADAKASGILFVLHSHSAGNTCGVPGFGNGTNAVDSNGNLFADSDYIKIKAEYALGSAPTNFIPFTDPSLKISGIYPWDTTVPSNDWQGNAGKLPNGTRLYSSIPLPNAVTNTMQDGTIIRLTVLSTPFIDPRTGISCSFYTNNTFDTVLYK